MALEEFRIYEVEWRDTKEPKTVMSHGGHAIGINTQKHSIAATCAADAIAFAERHFARFQLISVMPSDKLEHVWVDRKLFEEESRGERE